jgi:hypothetical protein
LPTPFDLRANILLRTNGQAFAGAKTALLIASENPFVKRWGRIYKTFEEMVFSGGSLALGTHQKSRKNY